MRSTFPSKFIHAVLGTILLLSALSGCAGYEQAAVASPTLPPGYRMPGPGEKAPTAAPPGTSTPLPTATPDPGYTATPVLPKVWLSPDLPEAFAQQLKLPSGWQRITEHDSANLWVDIPSLWAFGNAGGDPSDMTISRWIYAVVAPFPTVMDEISDDAIRKAWTGDLSEAPGGKPLLMTPETLAVLNKSWGDRHHWGPASPKGVKTVQKAALLDAAWKDQPSWAIIPFEDIEPRWKVLKVDGQSPLDKDFDPETYPESVVIDLSGDQNGVTFIPGSFKLPTNRDPQKLTTLVLTGVTAISRQIAEKMESNGMTYPDRDIHDWLAGADLTHISNEVSFYKDCPKPGPDRRDMRFCSSPKYIQLLEDAGTDIVELTGNHILDWGIPPFLDTLAMYKQRGWLWYGGGATQAEARKPLLIENHGNKLAFIGCSPAGPEPVWATSDKPGSATCDLTQMDQAIRDLRGQGYLPIVTFQHVETDGYLPSPASGGPDFRRMAAAGAVIVSGSQSHYAQTMTFVNSNFVHYGLGNLFFDQMEPKEIRNLFVDRHVFYDGKYLGVELLTAVQEDASRPRPMTVTERAAFLEKLFGLSVWENK